MLDFLGLMNLPLIAVWNVGQFKNLPIICFDPECLAIWRVPLCQNGADTQLLIMPDKTDGLLCISIFRVTDDSILHIVDFFTEVY